MVAASVSPPENSPPLHIGSHCDGVEPASMPFLPAMEVHYDGSVHLGDEDKVPLHRQFLRDARVRDEALSLSYAAITIGARHGGERDIVDRTMLARACLSPSL